MRSLGEPQSSGPPVYRLVAGALLVMIMPVGLWVIHELFWIDSLWHMVMRLTRGHPGSVLWLEVNYPALKVMWLLLVGLAAGVLLRRFIFVLVAPLFFWMATIVLAWLVSDPGGPWQPLLPWNIFSEDAQGFPQLLLIVTLAVFAGYMAGQALGRIRRTTVTSHG